MYTCVVFSRTVAMARQSLKVASKWEHGIEVSRVLLELKDLELQQLLSC